MGRRPFVLLDRDGPLLEDPGFVHRIADYRPLPGALQGLRLLQEAELGLAVLTNQSGIGRGIFSKEDYDRFQTHFIQDFAAHGVRIAASYFCPHAPDAGCECRKPATSMLERAERELDIDLARSWVIGDRPEDMQLARRGGCRGVYVLTGEGAHRRNELDSDVIIAVDLVAAARLITQRSRSRSSATTPR